MYFKGIEHYDHFSDCTVFWVEISDVPPDIQDAAAAMDGDAYSSDCFGLCISHKKDSGQLEIMTEWDRAGRKPLNNLYVDSILFLDRSQKNRSGCSSMARRSFFCVRSTRL